MFRFALVVSVFFSLSVHGQEVATQMWTVTNQVMVAGETTVPKPVAGVTELVTPRTSALESNRRKQLDPKNDGWETESFVEEAEARLKQALTQLFHGEPGAIQQDLVAVDFGCAPLRPTELRTVFRDSSVEVRRGDSASLASAPVRYRGRSGFAQSVRELLVPYQNSDDLLVGAKIYRVVTQASMGATTVLLELGGRNRQRIWQIRTKWDCLWQRTGGQAPRLSAIRVRDFEEAYGRAEPRAWFADCTRAVLSDNPSFGEQLVYGLDHWLQRIERAHRIHAFAATGLAVGDVNGDGLDDLYVCQPGGLPNRLLVQQQDGSAMDYSVLGGVDWLDATSSALLVDLDNDGDQDLVLATLSGLVLMQNNSTGRFRLVGVLPTDGADMQSLSAVDYDNDSDLDLYVCLNFPKVSSETQQRTSSFVYHDANDGAANRLFRNEITPNDQWMFADVTTRTGLDSENRRHSLAAAWEDYDNDGDQDLYVANDYGRNCLYRNDDGRFVNIASQAGVVDFGSGMSVSWGDHNRDGLMDLYVGNMFSSAGNRITPQQNFRPGIDASTRNILRRFAKGNSLFENLGHDKFREVGADKNVEISRWAWSSIFVDMNNSGAEDIVVGNGYITTDDPGDL